MDLARSLGFGLFPRSWRVRLFPPFCNLLNILPFFAFLSGPKRKSPRHISLFFMKSLVFLFFRETLPFFPHPNQGPIFSHVLFFLCPMSPALKQPRTRFPSGATLCPPNRILHLPRAEVCLVFPPILETNPSLDFRRCRFILVRTGPCCSAFPDGFSSGKGPPMDHRGPSTVELVFAFINPRGLVP